MEFFINVTIVVLGDPIARGEEDNKGPFGWIKALRKNH